MMAPARQAPATDTRFDAGSFRDRDSRVLVRDGRIFRLLSADAEDAWHRLRESRLYANAVADGRLISARAVDLAELEPCPSGHWSAALEHPCIPFVSYPYEWSFGMLKDAALLQLRLLQEALQENLTLKDATPYNIQWHGSRPVFIDIGSLVPYRDGRPWDGYRQFCELFLFPLMLQAYRQLPFQPWLRGSLEGIGAQQMQSLLTPRDYLRRGVLPHIVLQARLQDRYADHGRDVRGDLRRAGFDKGLIARNVRGLIALVEGLRWGATKSEWSDYSVTNNYGKEALTKKSEFVAAVLSQRHRRLVWDIGCNEGHFSGIAAAHTDYVLALDADPLVIERLYLAARQRDERRILPLCLNLADPSPSLGWRNRERADLCTRGTPDLVLALAVIHHLVLGSNIPLDDCLQWFAGICQEIVIEFVDRSDAKVAQLLRNRDDIFWDYSKDHFEAVLDAHFEVLAAETLKDGQRKLYHARSRSVPAG